ncbi:amino acid/amide ABC transporter ATP-binding protein 2 (HAAT family) [Stella humosa]|uniref:Amino acid/amide ABC transporter ATP-binding protein 2 (HAAT family) n=1 Tax=Stella humosa TaxID=94 RepID=A0A3N1KTD1_9PROT|nr:ABC transporter ATP-binding protein [Stella humosa]ROP81356.1 amino acid/amide ABC transporter ATP-binding protein 2 (HAAT family) [Stella humosa]BBK32706.1 ABC transporter ATP-binding protein [Stella humosa]
MAATVPLLELEGVEVVYDGSVLALKGVSLVVPEGGVVALLGANGAGKSTTLKAVSRVLAAEGGSVRRGRIRFRGEAIDTRTTAELVRRGIVHVLEGRRLFRQLDVEENLRMGAYSRSDRAGIRSDLEEVYALFPRLRERRKQKTGYLSGGEQQMAAIGRGLMGRPALMLLDEPTMGLAPAIASEVFAVVRRLNTERGVAFLLSEQNLGLALRVAGHAYVLESGSVSFAGEPAALAGAGRAEAAYFGA